MMWVCHKLWINKTQISRTLCIPLYWYHINNSWTSFGMECQFWEEYWGERIIWRSWCLVLHHGRTRAWNTPQSLFGICEKLGCCERWSWWPSQKRFLHKNNDWLHQKNHVKQTPWVGQWVIVEQHKDMQCVQCCNHGELCSKQCLCNLRFKRGATVHGEKNILKCPHCGFCASSNSLTMQKIQSRQNRHIVVDNTPKIKVSRLHGSRVTAATYEWNARCNMFL